MCSGAHGGGFVSAGCFELPASALVPPFSCASHKRHLLFLNVLQISHPCRRCLRVCISFTCFLADGATWLMGPYGCSLGGFLGV